MNVLLIFLIVVNIFETKSVDDGNYFVVEMSEEELPQKQARKPFKVYWNVPSMQCLSKKIPILDLYQKYGIIQNENDSFLGDKLNILYDPGDFPAILDQNGKLVYRNGGVPQEGNLDSHLKKFEQDVNFKIPDKSFHGVAVIDFESWRPVFRQNFGSLEPYKDMSYDIEKRNHRWWPKSWIKEEAQRRFEESAKEFMQSTLSLAKKLRPNATWGYYAFPYCFNMASNMMQSCSDQVQGENDRMRWLWSESTALHPSLYSSKDLTTKQLTMLISGRISEADRVNAKGVPILPYFWYRYRDDDGDVMKKIDLEAAINTMYKSEASGFIIWGKSSDFRTPDQCRHFLNYLENTLGPSIAKITNLNRHIYEIHDENNETHLSDSNNFNDNNVTDIHLVHNWLEDEENNTLNSNSSILDERNGIFGDVFLNVIIKLMKSRKNIDVDNLHNNVSLIGNENDKKLVYENEITYSNLSTSAPTNEPFESYDEVLEEKSSTIYYSDFDVLQNVFSTVSTENNNTYLTDNETVNSNVYTSTPMYNSSIIDTSTIESLLENYTENNIDIIISTKDYFNIEAVDNLTTTEYPENNNFTRKSTQTVKEFENVTESNNSNFTFTEDYFNNDNSENVTSAVYPENTIFTKESTQTVKEFENGTESNNSNFTFTEDYFNIDFFNNDDVENITSAEYPENTILTKKSTKTVKEFENITENNNNNITSTKDYFNIDADDNLTTTEYPENNYILTKESIQTVTDIFDYEENDDLSNISDSTTSEYSHTESVIVVNIV